MMNTNLRSEFPHLCNKELGMLGRYMQSRINGADYHPDTQTVFHRKLKEPERQRLLGYIDGIATADYWADDDANGEPDTEVQDA